MLRLIRVTMCLAILMSSLLPSTASALPKNTKVQTWASGFNFAVDIAWVPGTKKVFVTEKSGTIRVVNKGKILGRPCARISVNDSGERGLLGIALHPKFKSNKYLYVFYTNADPIDNRVARFKVRNNRCRNRKVIVKGIQAAPATNHNGGHLEFVKGKLFVAVGENADPSAAQSTTNRLGKILRYNPNGSIPSDNPFGNAVWSYGHRNPFGLAHKPGTHRIYSSENGPSCDDELNLIKKGRNYGWGSNYQCGTAGVGPNPVGPIRRWTNIIVPTDPGWYSGKMKSLSGDLYMGDYGRGDLHRFVMNRKGTKVKQDRIIYRANSGILDASKGPGGWLYFLTASNLLRIVKD